MARARNIKPGFYKNEDLAECSVWARFIFPGLWMLADRDGRLEDRPKRIKGELLPFDSQDIEPLLAELASKKDAQGVPFIVRYRNSDGSFIQISKFSAHQTPHYSEKGSVIKAPPLQEISGDGVRTTTMENETASTQISEKSPPMKRGSQPPDSLIPDSLIPDSLNPSSLIPDFPIPDSPTAESGVKQHLPPGASRSVARKRANGQDPSPKIASTWKAYSDAYLNRYDTEPVGNAMVNGQLAQVVKRLGSAEAPAVAAFYVGSNRGLYVSAKHAVNLLLRDCEGLRTEWATGQRGTDTEARQTDRTAATSNAFAKLIEEADR